MRIGLITGEFPPMQGGIAAYADILSKGLHEDGHEVFVFSSKDAMQQHAEIPLTRTRNWNIGILRTIPQWARKNRLDIVNLQFQTAAFNMSPWVHFLPHVMGMPLVTTFHDLRFPYLFPKAGALRDWIVMHLANASSGVIITNAEDLQRVDHLRYVARVSIASNIPTRVSADYDPVHWREKMGLNKDDFVVGYFGFLNHSKGIDTLLYAFAALDDPEARLLMIGGRTGASDATNIAYAEKVDALIAELGLENQIKWTGYAEPPEVSAYLKAADIIVLPYRDGASYRRASLITSMELECPIITTKPAVPVADFESLLLVEPEDHIGLANAIRWVRDTPEVREQLHHSVATLRGRFDWDKITSNTAAIFQVVLEAAR